MKPSNLVVVFSAVLLFSSSLVSSASTGKIKFCKIDYLIECFFEPMRYFTSQPNGTGLAANEQLMEQYCFNNHDYMPMCMQQWAKRCASDVQFDLLKLLVIEPMQQSMRIFCDSKGKIRPKFLANSPCIIQEVKLAERYRSKCVRDLQANSEYVHDRTAKSLNLADFMQNTCCAFNKWNQCIVNEINDRCGKEAAEVFPFLIDHTTFYMFHNLCPSHAMDPNNPQKCKPEEFIAPKDYFPKGLKSDSLISFYFSYICPNVGFGIVDEGR